MPVSWEELQGSPAPAPTGGDLPSGAITAEQVFGETPKETPNTGIDFLGSLSAGAKKYWTDYVKLSNDYASSLKGDVQANPQGLAKQVVHSGKLVLDAFNAAVAPLTSAAYTGIIEPIQTGVNKMSELAQEHLASPDVYDPQKRREAWLLGAPVQQQYKPGVDWSVHQADVARTAADFNKFLEIGVLTGTGFIGGVKAPTGVLEEVGSAKLPLRDMVRLEAPLATKALQGLKEPVWQLAEFPGLKDSVERLTANVKQLALSDPTALENLATHVQAVDDGLAGRIRKLAEEAQQMPVKAQEALGEQLAKPRVRQVGTTPDGKPVLRLVQPEQGVAETAAEASQILSPTVDSAIPRGWENAGETVTSEQAAYLRQWRDLHENMKYRFEGAYHDQRPVGAHVLLDTMISKASGEFHKEFLTRLRENIDDVPVHFKSELYDLQGKPKPITAGQYSPLRHEVEIRFNIQDPGVTRALVHELTHAATVRWMRYNESHPLMGQLTELYQTAKSSLPADGRHYGLKSVEEFVAEAFTNPRFQEALSKIQVKATNLFSRLAQIVGRIFKVNPGTESLLEGVIRVGGKIMEQQKAGKLRSGIGAPVEMARRLVETGRTSTGKPIMRWVDDPVLFHENGVPITRIGITKAFESINAGLEKIPGMSTVVGKLKEYYSQIIQTVNPEAFGPEAKAAAAVLAKRIAIAMQRDSAFVHQSAVRRAFWERRPPEMAEFIKTFEQGGTFKDPILNRAALEYRLWNEKILNQDLKNGFTYEPVDNYLYHTFENSDGVAAFFAQRFGSKWNNPAFIKERGFDLYAQAVQANFKPRFTNPEDIMLARQHASDVAQMKIDVLNDLERFGLATRVVRGVPAPDGFLSTEWRAPNGERFWVHNTADRVMQNAFNTKSLWTMPGLGGDLFRGAMWLKNTIVPIKLALSLFHPLHVATIDNATGMVRASKQLLSGTIGPVRFIKEMAEATLYKDLLKETGGQLASAVGFAPSGGNRLLKAYQGKIKDLTPTDVESLRLMAEGGFIPEMSSQYRNAAWENLQKSVLNLSGLYKTRPGQATVAGLKAAWYLPFAAIDLMQRPLFQIWIPSLKIASYIKDVQTAFRTDPTLMAEPLKRQVTLRRLAKSVDNRYGEMAYNTLFWNRWVKDLAVANTLSLGWQMGFIREYGGGALDVGQFATKEGTFVQKVKTGMLDRPLFVTYYTTQALAYGGLLTWALTGQSPQSLMDYIYPKNGEENPDGTAQRVSTMFYPREFAAIYKHMENEGVVPGLGHLVQNKASGVVGLTLEWGTGVNSFGQEIRDPNGTVMEKVRQTLAHTLGELEPISVTSIKEQASKSPLKTGVMNVAGFSPAPKYVTEARTEGEIKRLYQKYLAPKQTPYERAAYSDDARKLRKYWDSGDEDNFSNLLDQMAEKYSLTGREMRKLQQKLQKGADPLTGMFSRLTWQQQKRLLDQMTDEEREVYLPHANREHLRFTYEPPEK